MKKFFKILLWIVLGVIVIGSFFFLWKNSQSKPEVYELVSPDTTDISKTTVLNGNIEPRDEIALKPQISGIISAVEVEPGQIVHEGDIIARIKVIPEASSLSSAQNRVENARIALEDATRKHERNTQLYERKVISREEFESTETALAQAKREMDNANDALQIVREGVSSYNASESNTLVRSTITGLVLDVPVKVGSSVIQANTFNDGTTVATIADMTNLIFKGSVDETEIGTLRIGMPLEIAVGALPDIHPTGVIEYLAPKGTDNNGAKTFEIKAALSYDGEETLRAGYSANATVILSSANGVLTLPESAVVFEGDSTFVYVVTDSIIPQKFERRVITTGLSDGINIEVKDGITADVKVRGKKI